MKAGGDVRIVLVTCGSLAEGRKIARKVVEKRLAACVNVMTGAVESHYHWKGKLERAREFLLVMKTTRARLAELKKVVKRLHSYEVAEFLVMKVESGAKEYLEWVVENAK